MNTPSTAMNRITSPLIRPLCLLALISVMSQSIHAQEAPNGASINSSIGNDGTGTMVVAI